MFILNTRTQKLPTALSQDELLVYAMELANTVQAMGAEVEEQKNLKDQMKAKLSELQARQTRISIVVATGKEYRDVEIQLRMEDHGLIQEVRTDTGEVIQTRPPTDQERQLALDLKSIKDTPVGATP